MKNVMTMMLSASLVTMIFILPSCTKNDRFLPAVISTNPTDSTGTQPDSTATQPDSTATQPDSTSTINPDSTLTMDPDTTVITEPKDTLPVASQFSQITRAHIAAKTTEMSDDYFETSNSSGVLWKEGDVYVFTTSEGRLGKFEVQSIKPLENYKLTIHVVIFNEDGSIAKEQTDVVINGTWGCDLDGAQETSSFSIMDFGWSRSTETVTYFSPANGAKFAKYYFN